VGRRARRPRAGYGLGRLAPQSWRRPLDSEPQLDAWSLRWSKSRRSGSASDDA
jgi:hypothetical protein